MGKTTSREDHLKQLMLSSLKGDRNAYREFLLAITPLITSIAHKAFNKGDVDDIVQDIYISIHKSLASFDKGRAVTPWVVAIANRRVVDYIRKVTRRNDKEFHTDDGDVTNFADDAKDYTEELPPFLDLVPSDTKKAIVLTKIEGYSTEEAAKILGIKNNALRTKISRGFSLIRKKIEEGYLNE